jgi:hypothetical protein
VTIDKSGEFWRGTDATDLDEYLRHYAVDNYPLGSTVFARCAACAGTEFTVVLDDSEGFASRQCTACPGMVMMLDSAEFADDADLGDAECPCGGDVFNVAVGFAFRDDGDVRWIYLGLRCTKDGTMGTYADWKIDYSPTSELLNRV